MSSDTIHINGVPVSESLDPVDVIEGARSSPVSFTSTLVDDVEFAVFEEGPAAFEGEFSVDVAALGPVVPIDIRIDFNAMPGFREALDDEVARCEALLPDEATAADIDFVRAHARDRVIACVRQLLRGGEPTYEPQAADDNEGDAGEQEDEDEVVGEFDDNEGMFLMD